MNLIIGIFLGALLVIAYLGLRYLRLLLRTKDSNYGGVQRSLRPSEKKATEGAFLPGSRVDIDDLFAEIDKELDNGLEVEILGKKSAMQQMFGSKNDIKRSYIIDAILERPKF
ncbi:MAG: hypothetical protein AAF206_29610 [Bacteroidota bacterium]